jgi:hypothetical protein
LTYQSSPRRGGEGQWLRRGLRRKVSPSGGGYGDEKFADLVNSLAIIFKRCTSSGKIGFFLPSYSIQIKCPSL